MRCLLAGCYRIVIFSKNTADRKRHASFRSLLKYRVIPIALTLLSPNMTNKLPHHPPMLREGRGGGDEIKKNYVCNKKAIYWFLITTDTIKQRTMSVYMVS
jgi:hypothetical protein